MIVIYIILSIPLVAFTYTCLGAISHGLMLRFDITSADQSYMIQDIILWPLMLLLCITLFPAEAVAKVVIPLMRFVIHRLVGMTRGAPVVEKTTPTSEPTIHGNELRLPNH